MSSNEQYQEGRVAYLAGQTAHSNPYDSVLDHSKCLWWLSGYQAAKRVYETL